jgi:hypothetical protein
MTSSDVSPGDRWQRRCWSGALGAFLFGLLGMFATTVVPVSLWSGLGAGALGGCLIGFLFGLDALEFLMAYWPFDG